MRFYLISDNTDTQTGLRLAGIEGEVANTPEAAADALNRAVNLPDVGIILITPLLGKMCAQLLLKLKQERSYPLITEIPDRHASHSGNALADYILEAVGIKL